MNESWSVPFSVMLVLPLGIIGALLAATLRSMNNDVYFQVGLLTTIDLSAKNAILIVEFAKDLMEKEGKGLIEATLEAVRIRLRPILMTSMAFILGVTTVGYQQWCWLRYAERSRYWRNGWDDYCHCVSDLLRTGVLVIRRRFSKKVEDQAHNPPVENH